VRAVIESMNGARFVHDTLEGQGWDVLVADAHKVKGLAPLTCKADRIDARVLAELSWRDLVPAIWLPDPSIRRERELARLRVHLVQHRTTLKNRIHATLVAFGHPCPVSDLFGRAGRELLDRLEIPDPWRSNVDVSLQLIDDLERQIAAVTADLKHMGADHRYVPLLMTAPGFGWITAFTVASEIGDITRFASPTGLCGYTGLAHDASAPSARSPPRRRVASLGAAQRVLMHLSGLSWLYPGGGRRPHCDRPRPVRRQPGRLLARRARSGARLRPRPVGRGGARPLRVWELAVTAGSTAYRSATDGDTIAYAEGSG
jgi:transposase